MATYFKTQCKELAERKAKVLVQDVDPLLGEPVRVLRTVVKAYGSKRGRNSYWGVDLDKPLSDGATGVNYKFIALVLP
jgi:hypothetical protein